MSGRQTRFGLGALAMCAAAACTTPVELDWDGTPSPGGEHAARWITARQLVPTDANASESFLDVRWSPVAGVDEWNLDVDGTLQVTVQTTSYLVSNVEVGSTPTITIAPTEHPSQTRSIAARVLNRASLPPFGAMPGGVPLKMDSGDEDGNCFGKSLTAANLDGAGGDDLLVGAPWASADAGAVFGFSGTIDGSFSTLASPVTTFTKDRLGYSQALLSPKEAVARIAIGAPTRGSTGGITIVDFSNSSSQTVSQALSGTGQLIGFSLASGVTTDVIDGLYDLVAGAPRANGGDGLVFYYRQTTPGVFAPGAQSAGPNASSFGFSAALLRNFAGTGDDFVVGGAPDAGALSAGQTAFRLLDPSGVFAGTGDAQLPGDASGKRMGTASVSPGDISGDGVVDFVTSAPGGPSADASLRVVLGGTAPISTLLSATQVLTPPSGVETDRFGETLFAPGDVTFDGVNELLVGAPAHDVGTLANAGGVYLYRGGTSIATSAPMWSYEGRDAETFAGASAAVGDFDASGYVDLAVGAASCNAITGNTQGQHEGVLVFFAPPSEGPLVTPVDDALTVAPGVDLVMAPIVYEFGIGAQNAMCDWDFGDGDTIGAKPCSEYPATSHAWPAGDYPVRLHVASYGYDTTAFFHVHVE